MGEDVLRVQRTDGGASRRTIANAKNLSDVGNVMKAHRADVKSTDLRWLQAVTTLVARQDSAIRRDGLMDALGSRLWRVGGLEFRGSRAWRVGTVDSPLG